jgi:hypothetical protein
MRQGITRMRYTCLCELALIRPDSYGSQILQPETKPNFMYVDRGEQYRRKDLFGSQLDCYNTLDYYS